MIISSSSVRTIIGGSPTSTSNPALGVYTKSTQSPLVCSAYTFSNCSTNTEEMVKPKQHTKPWHPLNQKTTSVNVSLVSNMLSISHWSRYNRYVPSSHSYSKCSHVPPILIAPSLVTGITSSIETSTPASFFTVQRVFSLPLQ